MSNTGVAKTRQLHGEGVLRQQALECYRQHAWEYFRHHACQRTTIFNFYLIACALLTTAYFRTMGAPSVPGHGIVLGLLLTFLSFIFGMLDKRNAGLVEIAEDALKALEDRVVLEDLGGFPGDICLFSSEAARTESAKQVKSFLDWRIYYGHKECFRLIFRTCGALGVLGSIYAATCLI